MSVSLEHFQKKIRRRRVKPSSNTPRLKSSTLTDITDRLVNNFLKMSCETAVSLEISCGPTKSFQGTVLSMEEYDVDEKYGHQIKESLYAAQKAKQTRFREIYKTIEDEQRKVKMNIPRPVTILSSSSYGETEKSTQSSKTTISTRSEMSTSLWSLGSSNSI